VFEETLVENGNDLTEGVSTFIRACSNCSTECTSDEPAVFYDEGLIKCRSYTETVPKPSYKVFVNYISNQTLYYTRCITPKGVTSLRCLSPRHSAKATVTLLGLGTH